MDESEENMSSEDLRNLDSPSTVKVKPKKRSLVERELETSLTARVTSPVTHSDGSSTSRYGRARRLKASNDFCDTDKAVVNIIKSSMIEKTPVKGPAYKMHASNSPIHGDQSSKGQVESNLENQIETIYNTNMSLSRFSSEEKTKLSPSPAKKFPKVYIRTDLIQTKEKEETVTLIKNMFSPVKSTYKPSNSHLSNVLERSSEKYMLNGNKGSKTQNGYLDTSSVVKALDFDGSKKKKKENRENQDNKAVLPKSNLFDIEAQCKYQVGDLGWARMGTYPFWPCMVTREPGTEIFVKKKLFGRIVREIIHVTFFGDNGRRSWIVDSMLRKFLGQREFMAAREQFTPENKKRDPRLYAAFFISDKKQALWSNSVEEAETLLREPKRLRIELLYELITKSRNVKVTPRNQTSGKITRTDSDVSLSESLYDTLFSEDDGKVEDSDKTKGKRNKSLDVSEVVTACLDNMAAKTGITKIQRQSHMDRWLQKAKSKTPEKSQLRVSVTVEKVDETKKKIKTEVNDEVLVKTEETKTKGKSKDKEMKDAKKKQKTVYVPTKKPYSLRQSNNEYQNLQHRHNEHDYSVACVEATENCFVKLNKINIGNHANVDEKGNSVCFIEKVVTQNNHERCDFTTAVDNVAVKPEIDKFFAIENEDTMLEPQIKMEEIPNNIDFDTVMSENFKQRDNVDLNKDSDNFLANISYSLDPTTVENIDVLTKDINIKDQVDKASNVATMNKDTMVEFQIKLENIEKYCDNVDLPNDSDNFLVNASCSIDTPPVEKIDLVTEDINIKDQEILYNESIDSAQSILQDPVKHLLTSEKNYAEFSKEIKEVPAEVEMLIDNDMTDCESIITECDISDKVSLAKETLIQCSINEQLQPSENKSATELVTELEVGHISTDITDCESNISEMDECQTNDKVYIDKETLIQPSTTRQSISIDDRSATEPVNHKVDADISTDVTDCESNMFETDDDDVSDKVSVDKVTLIQSSTTDQLLSIDNKMVTVPVNNKEVADKVIAECDINFIEMDEYNTSDRIFITKETSASLTNKRSELINNKTSVGLNNKEVSDISTDVTDCESDISEIREYNINDNMATDKVRLIQTLTAQEIPSDHKTESDLFNNEQFSDICNVDPKVVEHMELELTPSKYVKSGVEYDIGNREYKRAEPIQNEVIGENSQNAYNVVGMQYLGNKTCAEILLNTDKSSCNLIVKRYKQGEKSCNNNDIQNVGPSDRESEASIQNTFTGNMDYSTDIVNKEYDVDTLCTNSAESVFSIEHEMVEKAIIEPVVNGFMENDNSQRIKAGSITNSDTLSLSSECDDISHKLKKRRLCKFEKKGELGNGNSIHLERLVNGTEDSKSKNMTNNLSKIGNVYSESCGQIEINIDSNLDVPLNKRKLRLKRSNTPSETIKQENGFSESKESNLEDNFYAETESIKSENSDIASGKPKVRSNIITDKKVDKIHDPEFLRYLEFRQDLLIDEHPELTSEEIVEYLFKTWIYEESRKSDLKKTDDIEQSNLVKGLNQEPLKPKRVKKKMKKLIDMEKVLSKEPIANSSEDIPRDKPKRKKTQPYYNEEYSDIEEEIQMFEIFQAKKSASKDINVSKPTEVTTSDIKPTGSLLKSETDKTAGNTDDIVPEEYDIEEVYFEELTNPKPNVFKGFVREKVCEICEKTVNLLKCKGCNGMFHIDCVKKETEIIDSPVPLRGRKKKKKPRGRKPKNSTDSNGLDSESQSDEKSQDLNVSEEQNISIDDIIDPDAHIVADAENFETQLAAKMKELLEAETVQYDSYSSDDGLDWNDSVAGKCQIVDIKLKPKSRSTDSQYSEFKCNNCQKDDTPICFVCKSPVSPKDQSHIRQRCHVAHCHKYYHLKCLDHWPQTQFNSGEPSRSNKKINEHFEPLTCPRHVCHTCVCDDPRGCNTRFCGDKLARCVRCPATYHSFTKCLPAGTQILTASHIICPRHYEHRPGKVPPCHVNTGWCFICALGGTLICCEYCPTSFHAECLNIKPPEGGYMCEDCETGRLPLYGEMVWVKLGHYRWWPGIVLHPIEIPANIMAVKHSPGEFVVRFFGQYDHYWVNRGRVFPFQEGDSGRISSQKSKIDEAFTKAMQHAQRAFEILKNSTPNEVESHDIALSLLPPHYVKLRVNKPSGSLCSRRVDVEEGSLTQCECRDDEEDPCGVYSHCLNRMLLTECGPTCRTGERCNNRAFEKRLYPKLVPYRTPHRGWGLKTLEDIKAGHFVIEYVGELIDEEEFKRRMRRKHEIRDENFYFLTLDKERMIDAGPKGNLARFMNHCCEPNCETQKWTVLGDIRVGLFAIGDIPANSEVTFNYNLECAGIDKKRCMCGAKRCSGYIGAKPKQDDTQTKKNKVTPKRTYKKRKPDESPTTSKIKAKRPVGRPCKPRELTEIEKDLLIIKNATNGLSSDSEGSGRLSSIDVESEKKDAKALKRKRVSFSTEEVVIRDGSSPSVKRMKMDNEKSSEVGD